MSRNCPKNRRIGSEEVRGKPTRNLPNRLGTQVAALVREQELQVEQDGREQQTCDTKRQERELKGTLDRVAATMHGLSPTNKAQGSQLMILERRPGEVGPHNIPSLSLLETCLDQIIFHSSHLCLQLGFEPTNELIR